VAEDEGCLAARLGVRGMAGGWVLGCNGMQASNKHVWRFHTQPLSPTPWQVKGCHLPFVCAKCAAHAVLFCHRVARETFCKSRGGGVGEGSAPSRYSVLSCVGRRKFQPSEKYWRIMVPECKVSHCCRDATVLRGMGIRVQLL